MTARAARHAMGRAETVAARQDREPIARGPHRHETRPSTPDADGGWAGAERLLRHGLLRAKLEVGAEDDPEEQAADQMADRIMRSADGACCSACASGSGCADEEVRREKEPAAPSRSQPLPRNAEHGVRSVAAGGEALSDRLRSFFEPRIGQDLSGIRVSRGTDASGAARTIGARAFALGNTIGFGSGQYRPETPDGLRLIAHELSHVVSGHGRRVRRRVDGDIRQMSISAAWAGNLTDPELEEQVRVVRNQISSTTAGSAERQAAQDNLAVLNAEARRRMPGTASAPAVPRPPGLPLDQGYQLIPIGDASSEAFASLPEGQLANLPVAPAPIATAPGRDPSGQPSGALSAPGIIQTAGGASGGVLTVTGAQLRQFGFAAAGDTSVGLIAFPQAATPGHPILQSRLSWGHTAMYVRQGGQIVALRSYGPSSLLETLFTNRSSGGGVIAGRTGVPASIYSESFLPGRGIPMFTHTGARTIEFPISSQTAQGILEGMPDVGPVRGGQYTGVPSANMFRCGQNCVAWAVSETEGALGGRFGPVTAAGQPTSVGSLGPHGAPGGAPFQSSQGRMYAWMGETMEAAGQGGQPRTVIGFDSRTGARVVATLADDGRVLVNALPEGAMQAPVLGQMSRGMQVLRWGGRVFLVVGVVAGGYEIATAAPEQRARTAVGVTAGFAGGFAAGAAAGLLCGPGAPVCSIGLGLVFGIAGGMASRAAAETIYDAATAPTPPSSSSREFPRFYSGCFTGDTLIAMAGGGSVPISRLHRGDLVLSASEYDAAGCGIAASEVLAVTAHEAQPVLRLRLGNGATLTVTPNHPLHTASGWKEAGLLNIGDRLTVLATSRDAVAAAAVTGIVFDRNASPVYDLSVSRHHTFFAGGVLAHNKNM